MAVPGEQRTRPARRRLALSIWSIATVAVGGVAWLSYQAAVEIHTCYLYQPSENWAGYIGLPLLLLAAILAFRWRRRLVLLCASFFMVYVAGLLALWELSPAIWGPMPHGCGSF